jgi:hypothetical protein
MNKSNVIRRGLIVFGVSVMLSALSACGHHDLTAPCARDSRLWSFGTAYADSCGPLLPLNK